MMLRMGKLALSFVLAVGIAWAQFCASTLGQPPTIRSEGETELLGAIVLTCADFQASTPTLDITLNNARYRLQADPAKQSPLSWIRPAAKDLFRPSSLA